MHKQVLLFSISWTLIACSTPVKPFYWEIEKNGKKSHILGTMHKGTTFAELPSYVQADLEKSKIIGLEITDDLSIADEQVKKDLEKRNQTDFLEHKKNKRSACKFFSNSEWNTIKQLALDSKIKSEDVEYLPLRSLAWIVNDKNFDRLNYGEDPFIWNQEMMDKSIYLKAKAADKKLIRLDREPPLDRDCEDQLHVFSIRQMLASYGERVLLVRKNESLRDAYRNGDGEASLRYNFTGQIEKCLIEDRNKLWIPIIEKVHDEPEPFFGAVGFFHLIGPQSVFQLLEQNGFKVRRITED